MHPNFVNDIQIKQLGIYSKFGNFRMREIVHFASLEKIANFLLQLLFIFLTVKFGCTDFIAASKCTLGHTLFKKSHNLFFKKNSKCQSLLLDGGKFCDIIGAKFHIVPPIWEEYLPLALLSSSCSICHVIDLSVEPIPKILRQGRSKL